MLSNLSKLKKFPLGKPFRLTSYGGKSDSNSKKYSTFPSSTDVVVVGAGIMGSSIASNLTEKGKGVVILDQGELGGGTTQFATGLVAPGKPNEATARMIKHSIETFKTMVDDSGQNLVGFEQCGSITLSLTSTRTQQLLCQRAFFSKMGIENHLLTPEECQNLHPHIDTRLVKAGLYFPDDGKVNPTEVCYQFMRRAKKAGAHFIEQCQVIDFEKQDTLVKKVHTTLGSISCDTVVLAANGWTRQLAKQLDVSIPAGSAKHQYVHYSKTPDMNFDNLPFLKIPDFQLYVKPQSGGIDLGIFESEPEVWEAIKNGNIPNRQPTNLPANFQSLEESYLDVIQVLPILRDEGIAAIIHGPDYYSPDGNIIMGRLPRVDNVFVAAMFNSQGVMLSGGVGKALADWIIEGYPSIEGNFAAVDVARFHQEVVKSDSWSQTRGQETASRLYTIPWPHQELSSARNFRKLALHNEWKNLGACFGSSNGLERPNWFERRGCSPKNVYSFHQEAQSWWDMIKQEHIATRTQAGILDMSSFTKLKITGEDAATLMSMLCTQHLYDAKGQLKIGSAIYTLMLNEKGRIVVEGTVSIEGPNSFYVVVAADGRTPTIEHIRRHIPPGTDINIEDLTEEIAVLAVMGPNSRTILSRLTDTPLDDMRFPFAFLQEIKLSGVTCKLIRLSYVGEKIGWEIHVPNEDVREVFHQIMTIGEQYGLTPLGAYTMNNMRLEMNYDHLNVDIAPDTSVIQAGLLFTCKHKSAFDFVGKTSVLEELQIGINKRKVIFTLKANNVTLLPNDVIYLAGRAVGVLTSAGYGFSIERALGIAYVEHDKFLTPKKFVEFIRENNRCFTVEVEGKHYPVVAHLKAPLDELSARTTLSSVNTQNALFQKNPKNKSPDQEERTEENWAEIRK